MPELPEVETVRQTLKNYIIGQEICHVDVHYPNIIDGDLDLFISKVTHQKIKDVDRVGKYLIFVLEDCAFVSHLRMEGKYFFYEQSKAIDKHVHVVFHTTAGFKLCYHDTRKFGRMQLVDKTLYKSQLPLSKLANEPFDSEVQFVYDKIHKSALPIKTLLLNQSIMAGIGNIYANEICFMMNLNPKTPGKALSKKRVGELILQSCIVLHKAIEQGGTTIHSFSTQGIDGLFQVSLYVHLQKECKICGGDITKIMLNQRGIYYCKKCQNKRR